MEIIGDCIICKRNRVVLLSQRTCRDCDLIRVLSELHKIRADAKNYDHVQKINTRIDKILDQLRGYD